MPCTVAIQCRGIRPEFCSQPPKFEPILPEIQPRLTVRPNGTLPRRRAQHRKSISGFRASVEQDGWFAGRRRPALGPGGERVRFGPLLQMIEYLLDHRGVFDAGDDPHRTPAGRAGLDVDIENAPETLRPRHRDPPFGGRWRFIG